MDTYWVVSKDNFTVTEDKAATHLLKSDAHEYKYQFMYNNTYTSRIHYSEHHQSVCGNGVEFM